MIIRPYVDNDSAHTVGGNGVNDMPYDPNQHQRRSIRLAGYDYAGAGVYFVTVCTQGHQCLFGRIVGDAMQLNDAGRAVEKCWCEIPAHFPQVALDEFIIMPNHVHGILIIVGANEGSPVPGADRRSSVGANDYSPEQLGANGIKGANDYSPLRGTSKTIGSVVRGFKIGVTKWMRENANVRDIWQRNYYEHIVRDEKSLHGIRQYMADNPASWALDTENPEAKPNG